MAVCLIFYAWDENVTAALLHITCRKLILVFDAKAFVGQATNELSLSTDKTSRWFAVSRRRWKGSIFGLIQHLRKLPGGCPIYGPFLGLIVSYWVIVDLSSIQRTALGQISTMSTLTYFQLAMIVYYYISLTQEGQSWKTGVKDKCYLIFHIKDFP